MIGEPPKRRLAPLLRDMPRGWRQARLKHLAAVMPSNVDKKTSDDEASVRLCNYVDVYYHEVVSPDLDFMSATATPGQVRKFSLRRDDVLLTKDSETADDIAVAAYVRDDMPDVVCGYHLALLRPHLKKCDGRFLAWAMRSATMRAQTEVAANGVTRFGLAQSALGSLRLAVVDVDGQRVIADFLDRETEKIDGLVAKKQRLIELLQEKRSALISHVVTKGLDPDAPMKDSGIQWIGRVPEHWAVLRLKDLAESIQTGPFGTQLGAGDYVDDGTPVINPAHIIDDALRPDRTVGVGSDTAERLLHYALRSGDVVCARRGQLGRCAVVRPECRGWIAGTGSLRVRPDSARAVPEYVQLLISQRGSRDWLQLQSVGSTMDNLNERILGQLPVVAPSAAEQRRLLEFLEPGTIETAALVDKARRSIRLLSERRSALITAAVTGQIDVRTYRAPEPEEVACP